MVAGRSLTLQASQARSGATQLTGSALSVGNALPLLPAATCPYPLAHCLRGFPGCLPANALLTRGCGRSVQPIGITFERCRQSPTTASRA